ncbi:hypothetical protein JG687_00008616 [Phytophthora cactorum]|uniref:DDE Tnp4 domain-containing protein n=1 Tax=Phytophthora cactorum TaxID=29920 RepID=A0A8T1UDD1_9STRA|nr:hypothetical protein JG687_00008616 [Phytophthora cactorum]
MIPVFKKPPKAELHPEHSYINKQLAKARIKSEHCIGLLKMRFQYLREIRVQLEKKEAHETPHTVCHMCMYDSQPIIAEPIPKEWREELESYITGGSTMTMTMNSICPYGRGSWR